MKGIVDSALAHGDSGFINGAASFKNMMMTVGASGAVFGLLLGFAFVFPNMPLYLFFIPVPVKAKYMVLGYAVLGVLLRNNWHAVHSGAFRPSRRNDLRPCNTIVLEKERHSKGKFILRNEVRKLQIHVENGHEAGTRHMVHHTHKHRHRLAVLADIHHRICPRLRIQSCFMAFGAGIHVGIGFIGMESADIYVHADTSVASGFQHALAALVRTGAFRSRRTAAHMARIHHRRPIGAFFFIVSKALIPSLGGASLSGASAAVVAVMAEAALRRPDREFRLLLIGNVKLKWLAAVSLGLLLLGLGGGNAGGQAAHIGGALAGCGLFSSSTGEKTKAARLSGEECRKGGEGYAVLPLIHRPSRRTPRQNKTFRIRLADIERETRTATSFRAKTLNNNTEGDFSPSL